MSELDGLGEKIAFQATIVGLGEEERPIELGVRIVPCPKANGHELNRIELAEEFDSDPFSIIEQTNADKPTIDGKMRLGNSVSYDARLHSSRIHSSTCSVRGDGAANSKTIL
ncbi:MAG: hypothetical protein AAGA56_19165 [Myxococcota bacterium]